ncbi:glucokinase, variant 2 [Xanthoria calcicola]
MGLLDDARMVAAEFEYSANDVNKGVKEFIRQMDEGLQETGKSMSQIPTASTWLWIWVAPTSVFVRSS